VKILRLSVFAVIAFALIALSSRRAPRIYIPRPEEIMAEQRAVAAHALLFEMDYGGALASLRGIADALPDVPLHRRWTGRALMHLGECEEAAKEFALAASDSSLRSAIEADMERLRAIGTALPTTPPAGGRWRAFPLSFAQEEEINAVASLSNGTIATASARFGTIRFWNAAGRRIGQATHLGHLVALAPWRDGVVAADMAGDLLHLVSPTRGLVQTIPLDPLGVDGARAVHVDARGGILVADHGNGRVLRLNEAGELMSEIKGDGIAGPAAVITVGSDLIVAENDRHRLLRFDRNGRLLRYYVHPSLRNPVGLASAGDAIMVQGGNGLVFWLRTDEDDLAGPLRTNEGLLMTFSLGLAADAAANLWWGDGRSLRRAERQPATRPAQIIEVLRLGMRRGTGPEGRVTATVSVMDRSGAALESLERGSFRLLSGENVVEAFAVENLSRSLVGRRIALIVESSDELISHDESIRTMLGAFFASLTNSDRTAVLDVTDTNRLIRDFTAEPALVRHAAFAERRRVAAIDLRSAPAVDRAIRLLAPADFARAVLWVTSGEGLREDEVLRLRRMGIANQTPIFILHAGTGSGEALNDLATATHGAYFRLYTNVRPADLAARLNAIRSGRYRVSGRIPLPLPEDRGEWKEITVEVRQLGEGSFDRVGYYSF
jgi:hypothetical protein